MRYKKIVKAHVEEQVKDDKTLCDHCGKNVFACDDAYEINEVKIGASIGYCYPEEGDNRTAYDIDICAECFKSVVIPALKAVGLTFRERSVEDDDREFAPVTTTAD
jgi:hypothetical protein